MPKSLIALSNANENLAPIERSDISYPEIGATNLAHMEERHFWFTVRRKIIRRLIDSAALRAEGIASPRGLDIGCGTGFTAAYLTEGGLPTWGIDSYSSFLSHRDRGAGFIQGDIFSIEPEPEFDFVLLLDVIEHIQDDTAFLKQSLKFLRAGGIAIISVPAFPALWSAVDDFSGHLRRYTKPSMKDLVQNVGSSVVIEKQFYFYGATAVPYLLSRLKRKSQNFEKQLSEEMNPGPTINAAFTAVLNFERLFISIGGSPFGSSLFTVIRKNR